MHSFSDDLFYITVRLEGKTAKGISVGTGFYFKHKDRYFIVTNKHVVDGVKEGHFFINEGKQDNSEWLPLLGNGYKVPFNEKYFVGHPNSKIDVAVMNISHFINLFNKNNTVPFFMAINDEIIPTDEDIKNTIRSIEDIYFIGYPNGIWDSENLLPIIRKGTTSTPYRYNFMNEPKFLIDASVFPGSSGSPVLIYNSGSHKNRIGQTINKGNLFFLGIIAQTYNRLDEGSFIIKDIPTKKTHIPVNRQMIDLGIVFKASTIVECIEHYNKVNK